MKHNYKIITHPYRLVVVIFLMVLIQSCYVTKTIYTENIFNSWIGKASQYLLIQQGTPSQMVSDGNGGQIYIYDQGHTMTSTYYSPGYVYSQPVGVAVPGYQQQQLGYQPGGSISNQVLVQKKVEYFVNKDGYIYAWHSTGYPKSYRWRYTKKEMNSGTVDGSLFVPPQVTSHR